MNSEAERRVYLLTGLAGTGKTTIAKSVAKFAHENGVLAASFFCSRDSDERSNLQLIFPTIAFQLSHFSRQFRGGIVTTIKQSPDIGFAPPDEQLKHLIIEPRRRIITSLKKELNIPDIVRDDQLGESIIKRVEVVISAVKEFLLLHHQQPEELLGMMKNPIKDAIFLVRKLLTSMNIGHDVNDKQLQDWVIELLKRELHVYHTMSHEKLRAFIVNPRRRIVTLFKDKLGFGEPDAPLKDLIFELIWKIIMIIKKKLGISDSVGHDQFKELIVYPLRRVEWFITPIVIVIDALDECKDENTPEKILLALSQHIPSIPFLKVFATSRPEFSTRFALRDPSLDRLSKLLVLHEVDRTLVDGDIRRFLQVRLVEIAKRRDGHHPGLKFPWPPRSLVDKLVEKASGLFIFAFTICRFVESPGDLQQQLEDIANLRTSDDEGPLAIDKLYQNVVDIAYARFADRKLKYFCRSVVGTIVLLFDPVPLKDLAQVLNVKPALIRGVLRDFHSVLLVPLDDNGVIRTFHASFHDFLTTKDRCSNLIYVHSSRQHDEITRHLLPQMTLGLRKNICRIDSRKLNSEVEDLAERKEKYISIPLGYACRYWADHLSHIPPENNSNDELVQVLSEFIRTKFLYWIEVLSLLGHVKVAATSLDKARRWHSVRFRSTINTIREVFIGSFTAGAEA